MNEEKITALAKAFWAKHKSIKELQNKDFLKLVPIYAEGADGVAYYELWLTDDNSTPSGWVLLSATNKDYPVPCYSTDGEPYSSHFTAEINDDNKVYRFTSSYYALENNGQKIDEYGAMPTYLILPSAAGLNSDGDVTPEEGKHYIRIYDYSTLKENFAVSFYDSSKEDDAKEETERMVNYGKSLANGKTTAPSYLYGFISGFTGKFEQIPANTSSNTTSCWSGCNNNAWLNIYAYWDYNKGKDLLLPTASNGTASYLHRVFPWYADASDPVQMILYNHNNTKCSNGEGLTTLWDVENGSRYAKDLGYNYSMSYRWQAFGYHYLIRNYTVEGIMNWDSPTIFCTSSHAWVAEAFRRDTNTGWNDTELYLYPGWSTTSVDNVWMHWKSGRAGVKIKIN